MQRSSEERKGCVENTQRLENVQRKVQAYLKKEFHLSGKPLAELKPSIGDDLKHYLMIDCNIADNTTFKYIRILKQLLDFAVQKEWLEKNPIKH
jgi:Phage integrase SAM-like domain